MLSILYNLLISPIELLIEVIFVFSKRFFLFKGLAIIGVSIAVSICTFPLYYKADKIQKKERDKQKEMQKWLTHIKRTFKGDERFMMTQNYYRQEGYNPLSSLKGILPLFLQIPFFIAAYHFLSTLQILKSTDFLFIRDLGSPDRMIHIGSLSVNFLPILMTLINCTASYIYAKDFPIKAKLQLYIFAVIFLVLLYNSPSGLVLYWTCNNFFSLIKNICYKLKPKTVVILCAVIGLLFPLTLIIMGLVDSERKILLCVLFAVVLVLPLFFFILKDKIKKLVSPILNKASILSTKCMFHSTAKEFFLSASLLAIVLGVLIPSSVISSSPAEFMDFWNDNTSLSFIVNSICYSVGFFVIWGGVIFYIASPKIRGAINLVMWILTGVFLLDYMCFGHGMGLLTPYLKYENEVSIASKELIINIVSIILLSAMLLFLFTFRKFTTFVYTVLLISVGTLSFVQVYRANHFLNEMSEAIKDTVEKREKSVEPMIEFSKTGQNVVVFMLDRALSPLVPYILEERPELKEKFSGFTYYPNTISHGFFTNFGTPALFGGYEYTVTEMNKRKDEKLVDKHNEALLMMPYLFKKEGYDVTVIDPPYAGYNWLPSLSIYETEKTGIKAYRADGVIEDSELQKEFYNEPYAELNKRNFFCYSVSKVVPLFLFKVLYDEGDYLKVEKASFASCYSQYQVLYMFPRLTKFTNEKKNTLLVMQNALPHQPTILQLPNYELKKDIDNTGLKTLLEEKYPNVTSHDVIQYHVNMAAFLLLSKWFDFMKENGVYDNTRIILVADHGTSMEDYSNLVMSDIGLDAAWCNPLLLVKDFNATGSIKTDNTFMTNADTPFLAVNGIIGHPTNPFTGKEITTEEKTSHSQLINSSNLCNIKSNNGNVFNLSDGHWFSVHDDIYKRENWERLD